MLVFTVLTLFPDMIAQALSHSILGRARESGLVGVVPVDIRDFTENKHRQADDYPYGGGCGMVMKPEPVYRAYLHALDSIKTEAGASGAAPRVLLLSPRGRRFNQVFAGELSLERDIILICGHYEGIDERVDKLIQPECVSIGDYVLTGGEAAAIVIIDAVSRLVPGVLRNEDSPRDESFSGGLLEYPQYTRPRSFMGLAVPEVLLSGDHGRVEQWRREQAIAVTKEFRPDMTGVNAEHNYDLTFVRPTAEMEAAAMAFRDEFKRENSRMNGSANFLQYDNYGEWLEYVGKIERGEIEGRLQADLYFVVDNAINEIIGVTEIRRNLTDSHDHLPSYVNGHLGGSVRPSARCQGYAKKMLEMSLVKCAENGDTRVMVSCDKNNPASERVLRRLGGVFDNEITEQNGNIIRRFWFNLANNG